VFFLGGREGKQRLKKKEEKVAAKSFLGGVYTIDHTASFDPLPWGLDGKKCQGSFFFFTVLRLELRTLSQSTSPFFVMYF
jgi:hypothetical protein